MKGIILARKSEKDAAEYLAEIMQNESQVPTIVVYAD